MQDPQTSSAPADEIALTSFTQEPVQAPAIHPSRSAPLCKDCKHVARFSNGQVRPVCNHPSAAVSFVDGSPIKSVTLMRSGLLADALNCSALAPCGAEGRLFELDTTCPTCGGRGSVRLPFDVKATPCSGCRSDQS